MDSKERYEREAKAKGGSVPPDLRHHSKHRATERDPHKRHQAEKDQESAGFATVDIEHVSQDTRKGILNNLDL